MKTSKPTMAARQRAFRQQHAPTHPPYVGIWLRHGDAICLRAGFVPDSVRQMATEAVDEFWPEDVEDTKKEMKSA